MEWIRRLFGREKHCPPPPQNPPTRSTSSGAPTPRSAPPGPPRSVTRPVSQVQPHPGARPAPLPPFQFPKRHPLRVFNPGYLSRTPSQTLAEDVTFAALDFATTGLDPHYNRVCEAGIVQFRGDGTVLGEYSTLIDPQRSIPDDTTDYNGVDAELVSGAPTFADALPDILHLISGSVVVSHNLRLRGQLPKQRTCPGSDKSS